MTRKGDWIQTYTGKAFWPLDPRPEDICITDIAHALSMLCRFNGHCKRFYSVAEHSVHLARAASWENRRAALLHDASEAYLADVPRPVKPLLTGYRAVEDDLQAAIARTFGAEWPWPEEVHRLDGQMLAAEKWQAMTPEPQPWGPMAEPLDVVLEFWTPAQAKWYFLEEWHATVSA